MIKGGMSKLQKSSMNIHEKKIVRKTPYEVCNRCFHELTGQYIRLQIINGIKSQQKRH